MSMELDPQVLAAAFIAREEMLPEKGDPGPQGEPGPEGPRGPHGERGPKGDPGRDGRDGRDGTDGRDGDTGPEGPQGERGETGPQGPAGRGISGWFGGPGRYKSGVGGGGSGSGSGLPPQWTDGGNGNVTATVDDVTKTPITIEGADGQTGDLFVVETRKLAAQRDFIVGSVSIGLLAVTPGVAGNSITFELVITAVPSQPLTVSVIGTAISVTGATDGGSTQTSTIGDATAAINADPAASALVIAGHTGDGSDAFQPYSVQPMWGGTDGATVGHIDARGTLHLQATHPYGEALVLKGSPGSFAESHDLFRFEDEFGNALGDMDAQGNLNLRDTAALQSRHSLNHDGTTFHNVHADYLTGNIRIFGITINDAITPFQVNGPLGPAVGMFSPRLGQGAIEIGTNEADEHGYPPFQLLGPPDYMGEFRVLPGGAMVTRQHLAPSDAVLRAGDVALWFDQTDGAAKLEIKGKSADGTVVTGSVNLT